MAITLTLTETTPLKPLRFLTPEEKLQNLLKELKRATQNEELLQIISEWEKEYFSDYHPTSRVTIDREKAALALAFFLSNTIEPFFPRFIDNLKEIIGNTLPENYDVEQFIYIYKLKEVQFLLDDLETTLIDEANRMNSIIDARFKEMKAQFLALNAYRERIAIECFERLDSVKKEIQKLVLEMKTIHYEMQKVEKIMESQDQILNKLLDKTEHVAKKV